MMIIASLYLWSPCYASGPFCFIYPLRMVAQIFFSTRLSSRHFIPFRLVIDYYILDLEENEN